MKNIKKNILLNTPRTKLSPGEGIAAISEINDLKAKLEDKEKEAAANYDKYLRILPNWIITKRRAAKEKTEIIKYGKEELIKDILPFVDSLDRALEQAGGARC